MVSRKAISLLCAAVASAALMAGCGASPTGSTVLPGGAVTSTAMRTGKDVVGGLPINGCDGCAMVGMPATSPVVSSSPAPSPSPTPAPPTTSWPY